MDRAVTDLRPNKAPFFACLEDLAGTEAQCGPCGGRGHFTPPKALSSAQLPTAADDRSPRREICSICGGLGARPLLVQRETFAEVLEARGLFPSEVLRDPDWGWYCYFCGGKGWAYDLFRSFTDGAVRFDKPPCPVCSGKPLPTPATLLDLLGWVTIAPGILLMVRELVREMYAPLAEKHGPFGGIIWYPSEARYLRDLYTLAVELQYEGPGASRLRDFRDLVWPNVSSAEKTLAQLGFTLGSWNEETRAFRLAVPALQALPWR